MTHRLSSSGLDYKTQLQNLPRGYKPLFKAKKKGWSVAEADGAQLEFRIAAHLGRDTAALADIVAKVDVHAFTARTLSDAGQITDRQGAKEHTFKPLYGGSSGTEAEQAYYRAFKAKYPGITETQGRWINEVLMSKSLETEWGLRYYWPDTKMDASGYITNTTSICNYPVQAMATAEVIPLALVCMWHRIKAIGLTTIVLVNTVHDSIIAEVQEGYEDQFSELARTCLIYEAERMMEALYGIIMVCPLGCGVKIGTHWGTGEEVKYEKEDLKNGTED
jgi:DNA polymerase I-like protein with 3'-5' exonuclease and polymerase domains